MRGGRQRRHDVHTLWALLPVLQERLRVHAPDGPPRVACTRNESTSVSACRWTIAVSGSMSYTFRLSTVHSTDLQLLPRCNLMMMQKMKHSCRMWEGAIRVP